MDEFAISVATVVVWALLWGLCAGAFTFLSLLAVGLLERYMLIQERRTYPLWIVALALCPAAAFVGIATLAGLFLPARFYEAVRFGGLAAGMIFAVVAVTVVVRGKEKQDRASEIVTLVGSLLTDGLCCAALIWLFGPVSAFMRSLGGG